MSSTSNPRRVAVLTSGGDAAGMNAAVRGVTRAGLAAGCEVFGVMEGLQGLVEGGSLIRPLSSADVSGILQQGGTVLGTARSKDFRTRAGRRRATRNLIERGIDGLVVIGGDGSLSGADELRADWSGLIDELVDRGDIDEAAAAAHRQLSLVGLAGSIDNDMFGTDMTIGADTALHRITEAVDAIQSTASSHQRTFVIEVMGRHCGYLALMASIATGANFVLIPEHPPEEGWESAMCGILGSGRGIGRRASIVLVAEGAQDRTGNPISAQAVRDILEERLGEDARVTILGHVQRGGAPSAFDRYLGTVLGHAAVHELLDRPGADARVVGIEGHRVVSAPLVECVERTRSVARLIADGDYTAAMQNRGRSFTQSFDLLGTLVRAQPRASDPGHRALRLGVVHMGGPAPGMNAAVRVAARVAMNHGHRLVAIRNGGRGLVDGDFEQLDWMSVSGWVSRPGADLGTDRSTLTDSDIERVAANLRGRNIDGLLMVGGWAGYVAAHSLATRLEHDGTRLPIACVPASINNNLPATDLSIGADTALNNVMTDVDKIKESAVASRRCFIVEVMGGDSGYLPLMSGIATGAEVVHLPEEHPSLEQLLEDLDAMRKGFEFGKRRGLVIRGERAGATYDTAFLKALFAQESRGLFDVRTAVLGHVQQGGNPSPFDRIHATRLAVAGIEHLIAAAGADRPTDAMIGVRDGAIVATDLTEFPNLADPHARRPARRPWWMELRPLEAEMARSRPST